MGGLTFLEARDDAAGRSPARCPPFQVVSGEALRCRQSPICAGSARLIWAHLPFCALASSRPGAWFRVRTDARMIIRADLDWADIVAHSAPPRLRCARSARPHPVARPAHACPPRATASPIRATHPSMLHTPRLSLVPLGAEHFEPLAAMYAALEVVRFVEPAPLDRGEAWRQLAMHVGHRLLLPPGILGTWIRVGSGGRVCAVRVRRVEGARRRRPGASGQRPLAACGRTGRGEGRAGNGFARASGASFSLAATLTLSRCRTREKLAP